MVRAGLSRMSSVLGLKVTPKTAIFLPLASYSSSPRIFWVIARLRASLMSITASTIRWGAACSCPLRASALVSFGKQDPP